MTTETKACPKCNSEIDARATVCKVCGCEYPPPIEFNNIAEGIPDPKPDLRWAAMQPEIECFNCGGMMVRTPDGTEPGWYCSDCGTFSPDDPPTTENREQQIAELEKKIRHYEEQVEIHRELMRSAQAAMQIYRTRLLELLDKEQRNV